MTVESRAGSVTLPYRDNLAEKNTLSECGVYKALMMGCHLQSATSTLTSILKNGQLAIVLLR